LQEARKTLCYVDGRYQVQIPWKDGHPDLPNNYDMAVRRLECTEKRLRKDQTVDSAYCKTIEHGTFINWNRAIKMTNAGIYRTSQ
jgi:hypothetical protein